MKMWEFVFLSLWLGVLAVADVRWKRVPVWMLAVGGVFATCMSFCLYRVGMKDVTELLWGLMPGILFLLMSVTTKRVGIADGIVLLTLSLSTGYRECIISFVFSLIAISIVSLLLLTLHKVRGNSKLPYLPFLFAGFVFQVIVGSDLLFQ